MFNRNSAKILFVLSIFTLTACQKNVFQPQTVAPATLRGVPALKMNFRFESDVPAPSSAAKQGNEERNQAVQADFDTNRPQEVLDKTITSPDKRRVIVVWHKIDDAPAEFRLDMYSADGKLVRKITPNSMAAHFPDTIVWSPDSNHAAFVAMVRLANINSPTPPAPEISPTPAENSDANANANTNVGVEANANANTASNVPANEPAQVLTFRTEQLYIFNSEGTELKPLTQNEGMIYFYFVWSPDSSALAALAATWQEWRTEQLQADQRGEIFVPSGRVRLVEKNGRVRLLDDRPTKVQPVWSPDSAKIAAAIDKEVRLFDAIGDAPTQASIPLRNPLLLSSQKFDENERRKERGEISNSDANANANTSINTNTEANVLTNSASFEGTGTLPDENLLVSFNPIIALEWTEDKMLYLQTGYVKELKDTANSARSYLRWHRLIFSPQNVAY